MLALDIGTSGIRAALYDGLCKELEGTEARLQRVFETTRDGGAELDADLAVEEVARVIDMALERSAHLPKQAEVVGISCFWHSLVGVDDEGLAVTPLYGWADTRAGRAAEELRASLDEAGMHARTGCRFHPSYWPARLLWLREERSEAFERVRRWMTFAEYLVLKFFGETAISVSMASGTGLLNLTSCTWESELLSRLGLSTAQLPPIAEPGRIFIGLVDEYAARWPTLKQLIWYPVVGDGAANNIGEGCMTPARAALMIGTSGAMRVMWEGGPLAQIPPALWSYRAGYNRLLVGGALSDGGGLYDWLRDAFALGGREQGQSAEAALDAMEPDAHGLTVMPFWAGERSTGWTPAARGAILGLTMHTRPLEIVRAAMEAIAYRFAHIAAQLLPPSQAVSIVASGGALLNSPAWAQIMTDVLGRPLTLSGVHEASSRGAVLLALEAAGKVANAALVPAPPGRVLQPDASRHQRYRHALERQQKIYEHLVLDQELARIIEGRIESSAAEGPKDEGREG